MVFFKYTEQLWAFERQKTDLLHPTATINNIIVLQTLKKQ